MSDFIGILFDGLAYGSLLFLISVGLSVVMGLMNFVNLAHGAFAMFGGYILTECMQKLGMPFFAALPLSFVGAALAGLVLERLLYRRLYSAGALQQVLFSIALVFMAMAAATYVWGPSQQPVSLPDSLRKQISLFGLQVSAYRAFLIAAVAILTVALIWLMEHTRFGSQIRAAVDNRQVAAAMGIKVNVVFSLAFALGSGLAGLGGALGVDVLGLDPAFPIKYMVYFLLVVAVGGVGSIRGPLIAALALGVVDVVGKYYVPAIGAFLIYVLMVMIIVFFPNGTKAMRHS